MEKLKEELIKDFRGFCDELMPKIKKLAFDHGLSTENCRQFNKAWLEVIDSVYDLEDVVTEQEDEPIKKVDPDDEEEDL